MKKSMGLLILLLGVTLAGCNSSFWGGTGAGVLGAGAGYEYKANREMKQIDDELKSGKITQEEYNIRKDQIQRGSILQ